MIEGFLDFKNQLKELYADMLEVLLLEQDLYPFAIQWGQLYFQQKPRILVVGKATNGWVTDSRKIEILFGDHTVERIFNRDSQMVWVKKGHGGKRYNTNRSAFWRIVRQATSNILAEKDWYNRIAWTNLYKVSFQKGNPNKALMSGQFWYCVDILKAELNFFQPDIVLFFTSGWEKPFLDTLFKNEELEHVEKLNWGKKPYQTSLFLEKRNFRKYLITVHPQGKLEADHVLAIKKVLSNTHFPC
jgi:hypothetical protein